MSNREHHLCGDGMHKVFVARLLTLFCMVCMKSTGDAVAESLELTMVQSHAGKTGAFEVLLHNGGTQALILNIGFMLGNGKVQYPEAVHLVLADRHGKVLNLSLTGPALIAGRVDPMVVPLVPGSTFSIPVRLSEYSDAKQNAWKLALPVGTYSLYAVYKGVAVTQRAANLDMQGIALMPYWTGETRSADVTFRIDGK